jgi:hypothetical protein
MEGTFFIGRKREKHSEGFGEIIHIPIMKLLGAIGKLMYKVFSSERDGQKATDKGDPRYFPFSSPAVIPPLCHV